MEELVKGEMFKESNCIIERIFLSVVNFPNPENLIPPPKNESLSRPPPLPPAAAPFFFLPIGAIDLKNLSLSIDFATQTKRKGRAFQIIQINLDSFRLESNIFELGTTISARNGDRGCSLLENLFADLRLILDISEAVVDFRDEFSPPAPPATPRFGHSFAHLSGTRSTAAWSGTSFWFY